MLNEKAYPKPWEIALSKILFLPLGIAQIGVIAYFIILLFGPIIWMKLLILFFLDIAIGYCFKNAKAILDMVKNDNDTSRK